MIERTNTLENIIDSIIEHDEKHPDHGIGCACIDKHAGSIRRLIMAKMGEPNGLGIDESKRKSLQNLKVVFGYISRNG